jgi:PAS domain S-box-containing protein
MYKIALIIAGKVTDYFNEFSDRIQVYNVTSTPEAVDLAHQLESSNSAKAIVAPTLMAVFLKKHVQIPVIPAEITYFDIVETLRYAEKKSGIYGEKVALVIHALQKIEIEKIRPYISNRMYVFTYQSESDIGKIIEELKTQHFHLAVGGTTTYKLGQLAGMKCYLLRFGRETLLTSIERATAILDYNAVIREKNQRLRTVLESMSEGVMVIDRNGKIIEANSRAKEIFNMSQVSSETDLMNAASMDSEWKKILEGEARQRNEIKELGKVKVFVNREPILINEQNAGWIVFFQEVAKIEKMEQESRKIRTSGFVAKYQFQDILGNSSVIRNAIAKAIAFARVEATVLLEGESGTGKELFAQSIHNLSQRKIGPFVAINCAAVPEALLESELMGYEEGAFTGAKKGGKPGLFELAHNGTIFLDEIDQIPMHLQARILRVLQEKQVMRLGAERVVPINIRVIAATNAKLDKLVFDHRFREDLFYRLNVLRLRLPILRERQEDIAELLHYFLEVFTAAYGSKKNFSQETIRLMARYSWPGNVRELMNFVERFAVISKQIDISDWQYSMEYLAATDNLAEHKQSEADGISIKISTLQDMEQQLISKVLQLSGGSKAHAASILGVSRTTLWKKIKQDSCPSSDAQ